MTQPTCENCRWWQAPAPVPRALIGTIVQNDYGLCLNMINDRIDWNTLPGRPVRVVSKSRAEHSCIHAVKGEQNDA